MPAAPPAGAEGRRNFKLAVWNGVLFQAAEGLVDPVTVIPVLLSRLTTSNALIGFATAMSDMGWLLPQILVAPWASRHPRQMWLYRRAAMVRAVGLFTVAALAIPLAGHPAAMLAVFFIGYGSYSFAAGAGAVAFMEVVGRTVPREQLTPLWAQRLFWGGILSAVGAIGVRQVLELESHGLRFAILFGGALVFAASGWMMFMRIREPAHPPGAGGASPLGLLREGLELLRTDTVFRRLLVARSVLNVWFAASPFMVLFAVNDLGGQLRAAGTFLIARIAGFVLGNLVWMPLARHHGNRAIMLTGTVLAGTLALLAAAIALASPWKFAWISAHAAVISLEVLAFFGGVVHSALSVGYASLSIELAPPGRRQAFVSLLNTFVGPTMLLPMLGGALLDVSNAPVLFALCGVLALIGSHAASKLPRPHEIGHGGPPEPAPAMP